MNHDCYARSTAIRRGRFAPGRVSVDTSRAAVDVSNSVLPTRIGIGNLIAIKGSTEREFLIGHHRAGDAESGVDALPDELPADGDDLPLTAVPTGHSTWRADWHLRTVDGEKKNTFKRGADSFPQIDRECYVVEGANLQRFMGILGADYPPNERLKLGVFVADRTAEAIASGDKFFQRHAAILGSTGSGKKLPRGGFDP